MDFKAMVEKARGTGTLTELADRIGVSASNLTSAVNGRRAMPEPPCARLAELLKMDYGTVRKAHNEAHAKTDEERSLWKKVAAVGFAAIISGPALPPDAQAGQASMTGVIVNQCRLCKVIGGYSERIKVSAFIFRKV